MDESKQGDDVMQPWRSTYLIHVNIQFYKHLKTNSCKQVLNLVLEVYVALQQHP